MTCLFTHNDMSVHTRHVCSHTMIMSVHIQRHVCSHTMTCLFTHNDMSVHTSNFTYFISLRTVKCKTFHHVSD